jgi:CheY-like chemotaxis protein
MRSGKVLLVEDNADDVTFVRMAFQKNKVAEVLEVVSSGSEAIQYLGGAGPYADRQKYPMPSLLLLDLGLPLVDGFEVLKWVRAHQGLSRLPIAVLTGSEYPQHRRRAYELGANSFVIKPGGLEGFYAMINAVLGFWLNCCELPQVRA